VTGEDGRVEVRAAADGRRVRPALRGLGAPAQALAFSPDSTRLAVADLEGNFRVFDLTTGAVRRPPRLKGFPVHASFSPDGRTLAIADAGLATELRDTRTLDVVARLRNATGDEDRRVRFSPDGRLLAVGSAAGYTQLWDVARRTRVGQPLRGHEFDVFGAEFAPDGQMLATSGFDGTVILWDVASHRALGTLPGPLGPTSVRFSPDGRRLFVLDDTGTAQRWEVSPEAWSRQACRVAGRGLTRAEWDEVVPDQEYRRVCS
jgi:WD40 repeat protein